MLSNVSFCSHIPSSSTLVCTTPPIYGYACQPKHELKQVQSVFLTSKTKIRQGLRKLQQFRVLWHDCIRVAMDFACLCHHYHPGLKGAVFSKWDQKSRRRTWQTYKHKTNCPCLLFTSKRIQFIHGPLQRGTK